MAAKKKQKKKAASSVMELTEIRCTIGMTVPTGGYSSFRIDVGATARKPEGGAFTRKEFDEAYDKLTTLLQTKVEEAAAEMAEEEKE